MVASKILIVEDEGIVGLELSQALDKMGYDVMPVVTSGNDAIGSVVVDRPDLILMDIRLDGELDGIETARRIRDDFSIPVIYLTAYSDENTIQRAKITESFGYLLKPFDERSLRAAIEMALYKSQREREAMAEHEWNSVIVTNLQEGRIITDIKGTIRYINPVAAAMLGRTEGECHDRNVADVLTSVNLMTKKPVSLPIFRVIVDQEVTVSDNFLIRQASGGEVSTEYTMTPIKNRNGNTFGIIILLKEISGKEKTEKELRFEIERSKKFQLNLLPEKRSTIHGIKSDWIFYPCTYGSGDIFNIFSLPCRHVGFYILDVMGHGFSASVLSTTIYSFLSHDIARMGILKRYEGKNPPPDDGVEEKSWIILRPQEVIRELNKRFYFKSNDNPFFTLIYGIIDPESGKGTLARAGHPYPLLGSKSDRVKQFYCDGQAIGVFPDIAVDEKEFDFDSGSRLFLYSDGLADMLSGDKTSSGEALADLINKNRHVGIEEICSRVDAEVLRIHPEPDYTDDIAFFALERE
jgi:PAS domain S-box-containing protein